MPRSTVTSKGQTTIPGTVRTSLGIKPGDRLEYAVVGDTAVLRVHPGLDSLAGALASAKGKGMTLDQIREAATRGSRRRGVPKW